MNRIPITLTGGAVGGDPTGMFLFGEGYPITQLGMTCNASTRGKPKAIGEPRRSPYAIGVTRNKPVAITGKR